MRQFLVIITISILSVIIANATETEELQTYFNETFAAEMPADFSTIDRDGQQIYFTMIQAGFDQGDAWKCLREKGSSNYYAASTSKYKVSEGEEPKPSDDWLITPAIRVLNSDAELSWRANSISNDTPNGDTYSVYVSVNGNSPDNFISTPLTTITEESVNEWTNHSISLSEYAGKEIHLAFVNQSCGCEILAVDDITVVGSKGYFELSTTIPENIFGSQQADISAQLTVFDGNKLANTRLKAYLQIEGQTYCEEIVLGNPAQSTSFTFSDLPTMEIPYGETINYTLWGDIDNIPSNVVEGSISSYLFQTERNTVIEEGTGMWCRYCPLGIVAFDRMKEKYGDRLIAIALHYEDALAVDEYVESLMFDQYPSGLINRKVEAEPMVEAEINGKKDYTMDGGWETYFLASQEEIATAQITATASLDSENKIHISTETRFAIPYSEADIRQIFVVVEDGVEGYQINGFAGRDYSLDGWEDMPEEIRPYVFNDVARGVAEDWQGVAECLPTYIEEGITYDFDYQFAAPHYSNCENLRIVAMLYDMNSGVILNATKSDIDTSGIETIHDFDTLQIKVADGRVFINGQAAQLFSLTGIQLPNCDVTPDVYIAKTMKSNKLIITKIIL